MKGLIITIITVVMSLSVAAFVGADHLTADPQSGDVVTKYRIELNGEILDAEIETVSETQVKLYYNVDHLRDGKHVASAAAGNDKGEWSKWSESLEFYRGMPTPQNIGIYREIEGEEPKRLSRDGWKIIHVSSEDVESGKVGTLAIDENINTYWRTSSDKTHPHEIQIDLGKTYTITGFYYLARQDERWYGVIKKYIFYISSDGSNWVEVSSGELAKTRDEQLIEVPPQTGRYISLVALSDMEDGIRTTVAELNVLGY